MSQILAAGASQRQLASHLNVSAATVNQMIKDAVLDGCIEKVGESPRQICYQLTSRGKTQVGRLAKELLFVDTNLYATLRAWLERKVQRLKRDGVKRVAIWGQSDLLEPCLVALQKELRVVGLGPDAGYGLPAFDLARQADTIDAFISVINELPGELRRTLREREVPLVFIT